MVKRKQSVYMAQTLDGWVVKRLSGSGKNVRVLDRRTCRLKSTAKKELSRLRKKMP